MRKPNTRVDLYQAITDKLIKAIEANPGKPQMPWRKSNAPLWLPTNALTGNQYRGINVISLWVAAEEAGYNTNIFATYKQWQEMKCQVRKGEKSAMIVKYGEFDVERDDSNPLDDGKDTGVRRYLKRANVFNASQVDGFELPEPQQSLGPVERTHAVEHFIANTKAIITIGGDRAYYRASADTIHMPDEGLFTGTDSMTREEAFAAIQCHELVHWTSHKTRCDRQLGKRFGDKAYCAEELIAEVGNAMLCAELGITQDVRPDHAKYLSLYLDMMKADPKAIFTAAAAASRALDYLKGLQPTVMT